MIDTQRLVQSHQQGPGDNLVVTAIILGESLAAGRGAVSLRSRAESTHPLLIFSHNEECFNFPSVLLITNPTENLGTGSLVVCTRVRVRTLPKNLLYSLNLISHKCCEIVE